VLVYNVEIFSAAYKAGIQKDDIITEFNGVRVKNYDELEEQKNKYNPRQSETQNTQGRKRYYR